MEDPACEHHLYWMTPADTVLIMKKYKDSQVTTKFKQLCMWIIKVQNITIYSYKDNIVSIHVCIVGNHYSI